MTLFLYLGCLFLIAALISCVFAQSRFTKKVRKDLQERFTRLAKSKDASQEKITETVMTVVNKSSLWLLFPMVLALLGAVCVLLYALL